MNRILTALVALVPLLAFGVTPTTGTLTGSTTPVSVGVGDQTDPHISGALVAYTDNSSGVSVIRYHDLATGSDLAIPTNGGQDALSDVNGTTVVYIHFSSTGSSVYSFDTATRGPSVEINPGPEPLRFQAVVGGNTVVYQDFGLHGSDMGHPEIVAYNRSTKVATLLTGLNDDLYAQDPAVSPDGTVVTFTQCSTSATNCHIYVSTSAGSGFTTRALTTTGEQSLSDTNGTTIVYSSSVAGADANICFRPVAASGTENCLAFTGADRNPNLSGNLIAFEHVDSSAGFPQTDIYTYDTQGNVLFRLTSSSGDEVLNDIAAIPGVSVQVAGRVVYSVQENSNDNVYAFSFVLPTPPSCQPTGSLSAEESFDQSHGGGHRHGGHSGGHHHGDGCNDGHGGGWGHGHHHGDGCDDGHHGGGGHGNPSANVCDDLGNRPLLVTLEVARNRCGDSYESKTFNTTATDDGVLCVENDGAVTGLIALNGQLEIGPASFRHDDEVFGKKVELEKKNKLQGWIVGRPNSKYTVRVYGADPGCQPSAPRSAAEIAAILGVSGPYVTITGTNASTLGSGLRVIEQGTTSDPTGVGCSSSGGGLALSGLVALIAMLLLRRPAPQPVRVRSRSRR